MLTSHRFTVWSFRLCLSILLSATACSPSTALDPIPESPVPESPTPMPTGTLQGFVTSLDGQPLSHVSFSIEGKVIATSSAEGAFSVSGLPVNGPLQVTA